jgi:hypothetical protein
MLISVWSLRILKATNRYFSLPINSNPNVPSMPQEDFFTLFFKKAPPLKKFLLIVYFIYRVMIIQVVACRSVNRQVLSQSPFVNADNL